jgi:hypothetical protein
MGIAALLCWLSLLIVAALPHAKPDTVVVLTALVWAIAAVCSAWVNTGGITALPTFFLMVLGAYHLGLAFRVLLLRVRGTLIEIDSFGVGGLAYLMWSTRNRTVKASTKECHG